MSWISDLWQILTKVATLTKEVESLKGGIKVLRREMNSLTFTVNQLKNDLKNAQVTTKLVLDTHKSEIDHAKEGIAAKFDVLTTRLDPKIADFERRLPHKLPKSKPRKS